MFKNKEILYNYFIPGVICVAIGCLAQVKEYWTHHALNMLLSPIVFILFIFFIYLSVKNAATQQIPDEYTHKIHIETRAKMMKYTILAFSVFGLIGIIYNQYISSFSIPFYPAFVVCLLGLYDILYSFIYTHLEKEEFI